MSIFMTNEEMMGDTVFYSGGWLLLSFSLWISHNVGLTPCSNSNTLFLLLHLTLLPRHNLYQLVTS